MPSKLFGRHRRRRYSYNDGAYLSGPFEAEDRSECGEADGGFFEGFFDGDYSAGDFSGGDFSADD